MQELYQKAYDNAIEQCDNRTAGMTPHFHYVYSKELVRLISAQLAELDPPVHCRTTYDRSVYEASVAHIQQHLNND